MLKIKRLFIILLSLTVLYGCAAAWFAAGGVTTLGTYKYVEGRVTGEYPLSFEEAWDVTSRALADLKINISESVKKTEKGRIDAVRKDGQKVAVTLKSKGEQVTSITIRVGTLGDKDEAEKVHKSIASIAGVK